VHLNRTGKRPVSKQVASEIWNLSATGNISHYFGMEGGTGTNSIKLCRKADNDHLMDELNIVSDRLRPSHSHPYQTTHTFNKQTSIASSR
jgi:hypothetical protein